MNTSVRSPLEALLDHVSYLDPKSRVHVLAEALEKAKDEARDPRLKRDMHWTECALSPMHGGICRAENGEPEPTDLDHNRT